MCEWKSKLIPKYQYPEPSLPNSEKGYCVFHEQEKNVKEFNRKIKEKLDNNDYNFSGYWFPEGSSFDKLTFSGDASFGEATFLGYADFSETTFESVVNFTTVKFMNPFSKEIAYRLSKTLYQKDGQYDMAGNCYYEERIARWQQLKWLSRSFLRKLLEFTLLRSTCDYGEKPYRVFCWVAGIITLCAIIYH
ncbi:pentapeptide repeat-containing protein [Chloroflexota bacterium]